MQSLISDKDAKGFLEEIVQESTKDERDGEITTEQLMQIASGLFNDESSDHSFKQYVKERMQGHQQRMQIVDEDANKAKQDPEAKDASFGPRESKLLFPTPPNASASKIDVESFLFKYMRIYHQVIEDRHYSDKMKEVMIYHALNRVIDNTMSGDATSDDKIKDQLREAAGMEDLSSAAASSDNEGKTIAVFNSEIDTLLNMHQKRMQQLKAVSEALFNGSTDVPLPPETSEKSAAKVVTQPQIDDKKDDNRVYLKEALEVQLNKDYDDKIKELSNLSEKIKKLGPEYIADLAFPAPEASLRASTDSEAIANPVDLKGQNLKEQYQGALRNDDLRKQLAQFEAENNTVLKEIIAFFEAKDAFVKAETAVSSVAQREDATAEKESLASARSAYFEHLVSFNQARCKLEKMAKPPKPWETSEPEKTRMKSKANYQKEHDEWQQNVQTHAIAMLRAEMVEKFQTEKSKIGQPIERVK